MGKIKLQNIRIILDKFEATYKPGDYVSGECVIILNGKLNLEKLEIRLFGLAQVRTRQSKVSSWQKARGSGIYYSRCQCLDLSYWPSKIQPGIIACGEHRIPFIFQLPFSEIPSSFEGIWGHIRYNIEAEIHKENVLTLNHKVSVPIIINSPASATIDQLMAPVGSSKSKIFGYFCLYREYFKLTASVDHCGQYAGQTVAINCRIESRSSKRVRLKALLRQKIVYFDRGFNRVDNKHKLASVKGPFVTPVYGEPIDAQLLLPIPDGLPVLHNQCPIIKISHVITVTLDIPNTIDMHIDLPIILTH